jgi:hypothetical protein
VPTRIADEQLAWMVRRDDPQLVQDAERRAGDHPERRQPRPILRQWVPQIERVRS